MGRNIEVGEIYGWGVEEETGQGEGITLLCRSDGRETRGGGGDAPRRTACTCVPTRPFFRPPPLGRVDPRVHHVGVRGSSGSPPPSPRSVHMSLSASPLSLYPSPLLSFSNLSLPLSFPLFASLYFSPFLSLPSSFCPSPSPLSLSPSRSCTVGRSVTCRLRFLTPPPPVLSPAVEEEVPDSPKCPLVTPDPRKAYQASLS